MNKKDTKKLACDYLLSELVKLQESVDLTLEVLTYNRPLPYNNYASIVNNSIEILNIYDTLHNLCYLEDFSKDYFIFTNTSFRSDTQYRKEHYRNLALKNRFDQVPLDDLELTVRTINSLKQLDCFNLYQLINLSEVSLIQSPLISSKSITEIKNALYSWDLKLC